MEDINKDENNNEPKKILTILSNIYSKSDKILISKENYEFVINYINNTKNKNLIPFIGYLNDINYPILTILNYKIYPIFFFI